jgi:Tetratricopeptide repeat
MARDPRNRRQRSTPEDDHPDTLTSASCLARDFRKLGRLQEAHDLQQDTLARRRRVLGDDHPDTLRSGRDLAATLRELGDTRGAQELDKLKSLSRGQH